MELKMNKNKSEKNYGFVGIQNMPRRLWRFWLSRRAIPLNKYPNEVLKNLIIEDIIKNKWATKEEVLKLLEKNNG